MAWIQHDDVLYNLDNANAIIKKSPDDLIKINVNERTCEFIMIIFSDNNMILKFESKQERDGYFRQLLLSIPSFRHWE